MKQNKQQYIIAYTGIFALGYVKITWNPFKSSEKKLNSHYEGKQFATKISSKWWADLYCKMLQKTSDYNFDFRTFKVIPFDTVEEQIPT